MGISRRVSIRGVLVLTILAAVGCLWSLAPARAAESRALLRAERGANLEKIDIIEHEGARIVARIKLLTADLATLNAEIAVHHSKEASISRADTEAIKAYNTEEADLQRRGSAILAERNGLIAQGKDLVSRESVLQARNQVIDGLIGRCMQTPHSCTTNVECECSLICASVDRRKSEPHFCKPSS